MGEARVWPAPQTGLMKLADIDAERLAFVQILAKDAGVPAGVSVDFDGRGFVENLPPEPENEDEVSE